MSRRLHITIPIIEAQRSASDPASSVWVRANAGSGKTYVLTARVLRLLLNGVKPEEILCLTYTKAAAAEMRGRVGERLGQWALMSEAELVEDLTSLGGARPNTDMLRRARSLFARALETPGGLRIQTIHAFCEAILHRFPHEARVPFDFKVLEEHERDGMLTAAREAVLAAGLRGNGEAAAVETLFDLLSDFSIEQAIIEALNQQRILRNVLADVPAAKRELRRTVGRVGTLAEIADEISSGYGVSNDDHAQIFAIIRPDPAGGDFVDKLARLDPLHPDADELFDAYLTQAEPRTIRKTLLKKATAALIPDIAQRLTDEAERLFELYERQVAAELLTRSEAMLDIVAAISAHYENQKRTRSLLDFDDLIERLAALLASEEHGPWVRYKLDAGLSHILVDEGQDTNPQQWDVVDALVEDFFVGDSAADRPRTIFAVGDQKQSIFSFQGADPEVFVSEGDKYALSARAVHAEVRKLPLRFSFRTLRGVLDGVDVVFNNRPDLKGGVMEDVFHHDTARADAGGTITLWPPIQDEAEIVDPNNWPEAPPASAIKSAQRRVAENIAAQVKGWITSDRPLGPRGRPVTADDVLILVQVRSVLFHEIIRALIQAGVKTPGADRLAVTTHIGVLDMMALGDVLSNTSHDLQLAALLRSPLFDISEEDLLNVAHGREHSLWQAMKDSPSLPVRAAYDELDGWRRRLDFERPFNFYADILYAHGGLKRMRGRFGSEIDDVMAEFLDLALSHEQAEQPSLLGFLAELRSRDVTIKRELAEGGAGVRVMTVHGAKGLEAPIVIMADAATTERGRDRRAIYMRSVPPLFIHASSDATHIEATREYKDDATAAQQAEYWRKLYVAMTRAEDELYVTGYLTKQGKPDGSWYEAIEQGLKPLSEAVIGEDGKPSAYIYPAQRPLPEAIKAEDATVALVPETLVVDPLPKHRPIPIVRPSSVDHPAPPERVLATRLEDALDPETARLSGTALHALLQHLGKVEPAQREKVAARALETLLPGAPAQHGPLAQKAISIITRPELAHLFGPNSRAEVPFFAEAERKTRNGQERIRIIGRIDRIVVNPGSILLVDFKSDASPVLEPSEVNRAYLQQLGLYALVAGQLFPGQQIEAAILWTSLESLVKLRPADLAEAAGGFTIR